MTTVMGREAPVIQSPFAVVAFKRGTFKPNQPSQRQLRNLLDQQSSTTVMMGSALRTTEKSEKQTFWMLMVKSYGFNFQQN
jgi:hypothetical protein